MSKVEEKFDIHEISIDNKTSFLTIVHDKSIVTKNSKILAIPGAIYPGTQPVHQDLLDVMQLMVPHMLLIIEVPGYKIPKPNYLTDKTALEDEKLKGYFVNGFSISEKGVISIKGGIKSTAGKITPLNAHTFLNVDTSSYPYTENLNQLVEAAKAEALAYFIDGKFGEGAQPEIFSSAAQSAANFN